MIIFDYIKV